MPAQKENKKQKKQAPVRRVPLQTDLGFVFPHEAATIRGERLKSGGSAQDMISTSPAIECRARDVAVYDSAAIFWVTLEGEQTKKKYIYIYIYIHFI